jgi:hypothetical protein
MHVYDLERESIERQLNFIAHDTQCTSIPWGDKRTWLVGAQKRVANGALADNEVDGSAPLWRVEYPLLSPAGVLPNRLSIVEPFTLPTTDWLQKVLDETSEVVPEDLAYDTNTEAPRAEGLTSARGGPRVLIELDDAEPAAQLSPDTPILLLLNAQNDSAGGRAFDDLQGTGEGAILASEAQAGMWVLIPRRTIGGELLDRLLERFELSPEYSSARHFRQVWKDAVALVTERTHGSAAAALSLLAQHGVAVTSAQSVQRWMRGIVVGPRSAESIRAMGHVAERAELIRHYALIHAALGQIRMWRIALGRKLVEYVRAGQSLGPDAVVDARLRLRRVDLEEVTRIGRVTKVSLVEPRGAAHATH